MTPDNFVAWHLSNEWDYRVNAIIERLVRQVRFRYKAFPEDIDYTLGRNLDRNQMECLATVDFVRDGQNLFLTGLSGTGKSFIATALGYQACRAGIKTMYTSSTKLI